MAVNLAAPSPGSLHPVRGVELGVAMAGIKKPGRKDLLVMRLHAGATVAGVNSILSIRPVSMLTSAQVRRETTADLILVRSPSWYSGKRR